MVAFDDGSVTINNLQITTEINAIQHNLLCVPYEGDEKGVAVFPLSENTKTIQLDSNTVKLMYDDDTMKQTGSYPSVMNLLVRNRLYDGQPMPIKKLVSKDNVVKDLSIRTINIGNDAKKINVDFYVLIGNNGDYVTYTEKSFIGKLSSFISYIIHAQPTTHVTQKYLKYKHKYLALKNRLTR